jgi:UPF0176 protein
MKNHDLQHTIVVAALYQFARVRDCVALRDALEALCDAHQVKGTLLIASEGINGTIAGTRSGIDAVLAWLRADPCFAQLEHKESLHDAQPFYRMKVRIKKEIVTLGVPGIDPNLQVGRYVAPKDWNALIQDPDVVVVDTRNHYECEVGTFHGAIDPKTSTFREFPEYVDQHLDPARHKRVAMFCTGGIRCEKATSLMLAKGFQEVFHLQGGILKYLEEVPASESLWEGECFVFDERVTVGHGLVPGDYELCRGCRMPVSAEDRQSPDFQPGVCCPRCIDQLTDEKAARCAERHRQVKLAEARNEIHVGRVDERSAG